MIELKPCPYCGEVPFIEKIPMWQTYGGTTHGYDGCYEYDIRCHKCGCRIPLGQNDTIYRKDEEAMKNAIESWNRRANDAAD